MKAITALQPFATLLALEEKLNETRSWKINPNSPIWQEGLLIHAGKGKQYLYLCDQEPFKSVLANHGYDKNNLPMGAIVAKTNLNSCVKVEWETIDASLKVTKAELEDGTKITGNELEFGNYAKGRYAWRMENMKMLKEPIPIKGQQRLWNFDYEGE